MFNIFEQPWSLLIASVLVLFVVLILRRIFPEKRCWWQLVLPAFFAVLAFGLDLLVQTDLEEIKGVISTLVKGVEEENCGAIEAIISPKYSDSFHNTKERLMRHCRARLSEPLVKKTYKTILEIDVSPPTATLTLTIRVMFDRQSYIYEFKRLMLVKVKLDLQKEQDNYWLIKRAEILEIDGQSHDWRHIQQSI